MLTRALPAEGLAYLEWQRLFPLAFDSRVKPKPREAERDAEHKKEYEDNGGQCMQ